MTAPRTPPPAAPRNGRVAVIMLGAVFGMLGLSYAAVPLYNLFCDKTGYGGRPQIASENPGALGTRHMRVRFDANVAPGLPLKFESELASINVVPGQTKTIFYRATNQSDRPLTLLASYNVTPDAVGGWFSKISCFCFTEQTIPPHETLELPVVFFLDPGLEKDETMKGVTDVTLSYTFYPSKPAAEKKPAAGQAGQG